MPIKRPPPTESPTSGSPPADSPASGSDSFSTIYAAVGVVLVAGFVVGFYVHRRCLQKSAGKVMIDCGDLELDQSANTSMTVKPQPETEDISLYQTSHQRNLDSDGWNINIDYDDLNPPIGFNAADADIGDDLALEDMATVIFQEQQSAKTSIKAHDRTEVLDILNDNDAEQQRWNDEFARRGREVSSNGVPLQLDSDELDGLFPVHGSTKPLPLVTKEVNALVVDTTRDEAQESGTAVDRPTDVVVGKMVRAKALPPLVPHKSLEAFSAVSDISAMLEMHGLLDTATADAVDLSETDAEAQEGRKIRRDKSRRRRASRKLRSYVPIVEGDEKLKKEVLDLFNTHGEESEDIVPKSNLWSSDEERPDAGARAKQRKLLRRISSKRSPVLPPLASLPEVTTASNTSSKSEIFSVSPPSGDLVDGGNAEVHGDVDAFISKYYANRMARKAAEDEQNPAMELLTQTRSRSPSRSRRLIERAERAIGLDTDSYNESSGAESPGSVLSRRVKPKASLFGNDHDAALNRWDSRSTK